MRIIGLLQILSLPKEDRLAFGKEDYTIGYLSHKIQIVGDYLEDRTTIAFAGHLSTIVGGFRPPPAYE